MRLSRIFGGVGATALGLWAVFVADAIGATVSGILLIVGVIAGIAAAFSWRLEWLGDAHRKVRDGAAILWPVAVEVFHRAHGDSDRVDRASLREIADVAQDPLTAPHSEELMGLARQMYPRRGPPASLQGSEAERLEDARVLIRDAVESLAGSALRRRISNPFLRSRLAPWHKGTFMLFWYMEVALAHQTGLGKIARYEAIKAVCDAVKRP